jgi:N-acetylglucosamine-6-phosphate deacetylase
LNTQAIVNGTVFDGENLLTDRVLILEGTRVSAIVQPDEVPPGASLFDLDGGILLPGFIDLQVNGGGGLLFNHAPTVETVRCIGEVHRRFGTTGYMPTLISDDYAVMREAVAAVEQAIEAGVPGVLGIHLEGPFLNPERRGIHNANKICTVDEEGIEILSALRRGRTVVTLAPEIAGESTIRRLVDAGVVVCAGHTAADYQQTRAALDAGVSGFTHLYNAMTPLRSREPGVVGAALEDERSWFGIIADGYHCHPAAFKAAVRAKQPGGAVLVTDAVATVGATGDSFEFGDQVIRQVDGRCTNEDGILAGSHLDMLTAVNNAARFADIDWLEAVRMASLYPARALGLQEELGLIRPGSRASLVALDSQRQIAATWIDGDRRDL